MMNKSECPAAYENIYKKELLGVQIFTFKPVALIFSASWSTATLLGAQTRTCQAVLLNL